MSRRLFASIAIVLFLPTAAALPARAAEPPLPAAEPGPMTPAGTTLDNEELDRRTDFLLQRLGRSRSHAEAWYWSWMTINAGSMVMLGAVAATSKHEDDQVNNGAQAGLAALGVADLLFRPLEARYGGGSVRGLPDATREEKIDKLRAAEAQLHANAERSAERTDWRMHAANVGVNGAAGLAIGLAGRPSDGLVSFLTGTAGGVIQILSQPWGPARDWQDYRQQFGLGEKDAARIEPYLAAAPGEATAGVRWSW